MTKHRALQENKIPIALMRRSLLVSIGQIGTVKRITMKSMENVFKANVSEGSPFLEEVIP